MNGLKYSGLAILLIASLIYLDQSPDTPEPGIASAGGSFASQDTLSLDWPRVHFQVGPGSAAPATTDEISEQAAYGYPVLVYIESLQAQNLAAPDLLGALQHLLDRPDPAIRLAALGTLAELNRASILPAILIALHDPDPQLRMAATEALAERGNQAYAHYLEPGLFDPDRLVVIATARALGELESEQALYSLASLLSHQDCDIRLSAVNALGEIDRELGWQYLEPMRRDSDAVIRANAIAIINEAERVN